jgi:hypothetical protein
MAPQIPSADVSVLQPDDDDDDDDDDDGDHDDYGNGHAAAPLEMLMLCVAPWTCAGWGGACLLSCTPGT